MTEFYFPFASLNGDRETNDTHFARFYSNLFRDGVIAPVKGALKVSEDEVLGSRVLVDAGAILIDGRQYMLTEPRTVQIKPAESTGDRTDLVVVRLDLNARLIELRYLENATNPVRTEQIWDMVLARINVPRNATEIKNADITDMRANDAVCGYSTPYEEIKVSGLEQQYQSLLEQSFDSFEQHAQQNKQDLEQYLTDQQLLFDSWFSSVKNILDENVATNLLNMITQLQTDLGNIDAPSTQEFESLQSDFSAHQAESTQQAHLAKNIGLEDATGNFTATEVEGAMSELFTNVSNGKDLVGGAITDVDDSVVIPTDPTFQQLAEAIGSIQTKGKKASGTIVSGMITGGVTFNQVGGGTLSLPRLIVSGLDFKPSKIFLYYSVRIASSIDTETNNNCTVFTNNQVFYVILSGNAYINETGFSLPYQTTNAGGLWVAYE